MPGIKCSLWIWGGAQHPLLPTTHWEFKPFGHTSVPSAYYSFVLVLTTLCHIYNDLSIYMSPWLTFEVFGSSARTLYFLISAVAYTMCGPVKTQFPPLHWCRATLYCIALDSKSESQESTQIPVLFYQGSRKQGYFTPTLISHWLKAGHQFPMLLSCVYRQSWQPGREFLGKSHQVLE